MLSYFQQQYHCNIKSQFVNDNSLCIQTSYASDNTYHSTNMESVMKYVNNNTIINDSDKCNTEIDIEQFRGDKRDVQRCHDRKPDMSLAAISTEAHNIR